MMMNATTRATIRISLPLMGIENSTTTHWMACRLPSSLPLMGIENLRQRPACRGGDQAHYPSWGSKTSPAGGSGRSSQPSHYPSWGSKTDPDGRRRTGRRVLITPHGDRKPPASRSTTSHSGASLPLMGIENRLTRRVRWTASFSLPLMGIENTTGTATYGSANRTTSLPLMGIENAKRHQHLPTEVQPLISE